MAVYSSTTSARLFRAQSFQGTGFLDQPPMVLREAVSMLKGTYELKGHRLADHVSEALKNIKKRKKYLRPLPASDRLYKPEIVQPSDSSAGCDTACRDDTASLVAREERDQEDDDPASHYGLVASANKLIMDALIRGRLEAEKGVLCFELEAAGLMNHFPSLVIRGMCDYSNSHKNKEWQGFAAMMAAAYARDLLYEIHPNKIEAETRISEQLQMSQYRNPSRVAAFNLEAVHQDLGIVRPDVRQARTVLETREMKHRLAEMEALPARSVYKHQPCQDAPARRQWNVVAGKHSVPGMAFGVATTSLAARVVGVWQDRTQRDNS
jgi:hypothetical protein